MNQKNKKNPAVSINRFGLFRTKLAAPFRSAQHHFIQFSWKIKLIMVISLIALGLGVWYFRAHAQKAEISYETAAAQKGTLINSISAAGTITSGNYTNIETKTSGVVNKVYVTNGDYVTKGQKIAEVTLDDYAKERQSAAWVAYLEAKEAHLAAVSGKSAADIEMWQVRQEVLDAEEDYNDMIGGADNPDTDEPYTVNEQTIITKTLAQKREAFTVAEAKYLNANADINNANTKVTAAYRDYQENSATIVAPAAGEITDLALAEGIIVAASSTTSETSGAKIVSSQTVGKINDAQGQLIATVDLSEIDIINVKANQKVTLTLDAYEDQTFTGKVMAVNTSGVISSGVTSYPVTILLDSVTVDVYPNMAVSVEIITDIISDVILIPASAVKAAGDGNSVEVMKDGQVSTVQVEVGKSNDEQIEIISGINPGDEVVTSTMNSSLNQEQTNTSSPFSSTGSNRSGFNGSPPGGF